MSELVGNMGLGDQPLVGGRKHLDCGVPYNIVSLFRLLIQVFTKHYILSVVLLRW